MKKLTLISLLAVLTACTQIIPENVEASRPRLTASYSSNAPEVAPELCFTLWEALEYSVTPMPGMTGINACSDVNSYLYIGSDRATLFQGRGDAENEYRITRFSYGEIDIDYAGNIIGIYIKTPTDAVVSYEIDGAYIDGETLVASIGGEPKYFRLKKSNYSLDSVTDQYYEIGVDPSAKPFE